MSDHEQNSSVYDGPAVFSLGFRPFFLAGALWAVVAVLLWLPQYFGAFNLAGAFQPLDWHAHEALFGYGGAVVAGFLLTAAPNWTGRAPVRGKPLAALALLWLAGRLAVLFSAQIGWAAAALTDCAFLAAVAAVGTRETLASDNRHNIKIMAFMMFFCAANVAFHVEAHLSGAAPHGRRLGLATIIVLVMLIGGRVIPNFTDSYLARRGAGRLPVKFSRFDAICMVASAISLVGWVLAPESRSIGLALIGAGVLNAARLARWASERTGGEALVAIMHLAYAFVPLGFVLSGLAAWTDAVPASAGLHAWGVGAIGAMTLAIMTRASLGHTGRALHAGRAIQAIYAAVVFAALLRIGAALAPEWSFALLHAAAFCWLAAFGGFIVVFAGALLRPRPR